MILELSLHTLSSTIIPSGVEVITFTHFRMFPSQRSLLDLIQMSSSPTLNTNSSTLLPNSKRLVKLAHHPIDTN